MRTNDASLGLRSVLAGRIGLVACAMLLAGCQQKQDMNLSRLPSDKAEMAGYYLPTQIEILPFTKVGSFDAKGLPDGINAVVRPVDVMGDPVKAYGTLRFELYNYVPDSGLHKGEQLMVWNQSLNTPADQRKYWDRVTQSYQFQLAWRQPLPPNKTYVLEVVYENPAGTRLLNDYQFEFAPNVGRIKQELQEQAR
jgi:hypothetical protein